MNIVGALKKRIFSTYYKRTTISSLLLIFVFVIIANFAYIFITNPNPLISRSGLPLSNGHLFMNLPYAGGNSIEGNDGITKQALGVQAAKQLLNGHMPLWNHYEGVGSPLLAETQSASSFPFTLLLVLPYGFLMNQITLEIIAGIGMYLFIRSLKDKKNESIDNIVAITGGCLFATLGTFMMLPNACFNPIAFLPWSMFGVGLIFSAGKKILSRQNVLAMVVLSLSIILAFNSGFPEIAYINMLLVSLYATVMFIKTSKPEKISKLISLFIASFVSILISLPWLIEFFTYINPKNGSSGIHNGVILNGLSNTSSAYISSFIPNSIGFDSSNPVYGDIGGYFMVSTIILMIFAILSKNIKVWHKVLFGGWFLIGWMRIVGITFISSLIAHLPMLGSAAVYRYIPASMSFCLIVLACLGINIVAKNKKLDNRKVISIIFFTLLLYGLIFFTGRYYLKNFILGSSKHALFSVFFIELSVFSSIIVLLSLLIKWEYKKQLICIVLILETFICFIIWQFGAYSKSTYPDTSSVQFLQKNLDYQRFESNFIRPNYGSYFNISQINMMDLPVPTLWVEYINNNIDSYVPSIGYLSNKIDDHRIDTDKLIGVKYILVLKDSLDEEFINRQQLSLVYEDKKTEIFELPNYKSYISGKNCSVIDKSNFDEFRVSCNQDSQLTRLELFYTGWHAEIDGKKTEIHKTQNLFQQIDIKKGQHTIKFYYWPKYMTVSLIAAGFGTLAIISGILYITIKRSHEND